MKEPALRFPYCTSIRDDKKVYHLLLKSVKKAHKLNQTEKSLEYAYIAATLAYQNSVGWKDLYLERLLSNISNAIPDANCSVPMETSEEGLSILFIASSLADQGGHSEVLGQWIEFLHYGERTGEVDLVITNSQNSESRFPCLRDKIGEYSSIYEMSKEKSYTHRIQLLRKQIREHDPDRIILFIHPNDVIALTALSSLDNRPTTIYYNHADHKFWLGVSILDVLINFREVGQRVSDDYRDIQHSHVVPLTASSNRRSGGPFPNIPEDASISVSVGSFYKTMIDTGPDYFDIVEKILSENRSHHHIFVTNSPSNINKFVSKEFSAYNRLHVVGPYDSVKTVYDNADFLLETIPVAGGVVQKEAMRSGIPIIGYSCQDFPLLTIEDELPSGYEYIFSDEEEIVNCAAALIRNNINKNSVGDSLREHYLRNFSSKVVRDKVQSVVYAPYQDMNKKNDHEIIFDEKEFSKLLRRDYSTNFHLLEQSIQKNSGFSMRDKTILAVNTIRTTLFRNPKLSAGAVVALIFGERGIYIGKKILNFM